MHALCGNKRSKLLQNYPPLATVASTTSIAAPTTIIIDEDYLAFPIIACQPLQGDQVLPIWTFLFSSGRKFEPENKTMDETELRREIRNQSWS